MTLVYLDTITWTNVSLNVLCRATVAILDVGKKKGVI